MQHVREILDRLSAVLGRKGDADLAEGLGVQRTTVSSWKSRGKIPYEECWEVACQNQIRMDWLLSGEGPRRREESLVASKKGELSYQFDLPEGVVGIPLMDIPVSAGYGLLAGAEDASDVIYFSEAWLWQTYQQRPKNLRVFPVVGNSMEPMLRAGEYVLASLVEEGTLPGDGVFIIRLDGSIMVKQLQNLPGSLIKVSSENSSYEPFTINLKEDNLDFAVLARVVISLRNI